MLKRNGDIALKKPESLSRARAQGLNNKEVDVFFLFIQKSAYGNLRP